MQEPKGANSPQGQGPSLCLEWKQLNYYVPAQEQSNYSFWNECRKKRELQILHDGKTFRSGGCRVVGMRLICGFASIRLDFQPAGI